MPINWKIFRIICILQIIGSVLFAISLFYQFLINFSLGGFIGTILFLLMLCLAVLALTLINKNYPDTPVAGKQKTNFNRLYLLNFLFLAILFGFIFSEYNMLVKLTSYSKKYFFQLPSFTWSTIVCYIVMLIFDMVILYGLYALRRELYFNFQKRKFEFEKD